MLPKPYANDHFPTIPGPHVLRPHASKVTVAVALFPPTKQGQIMTFMHIHLARLTSMNAIIWPCLHVF